MTQNLLIKATVPENKWLGLAWGTGMFNVDATWFAGSGADGVVQDLWMTGYATPAQDGRDDLTVVAQSKAADYQFEVAKP